MNPVRNLLLFIILFAPTVWAADPAVFKKNQPQVIVPAEEAFSVRTGESDPQAIQIEFSVAPGTYLYQKEIKFSAEEAKFKAPVFPEGKVHEDPYFGKVTVYDHNVNITLPLDAVHSNPFPLTVFYQG